MAAKQSLRPCICRFCKKGFSNEMVLSSHMCVKKKRYADRDTIGASMGLRVFQRYYEATTNSKKPKTVEDFINSKFYMAFVKFGRYYHSLNPVHGSQFIEYLIRNGVKLKDWSSDHVYDAYIEDIIKREDPNNAVERTILTMMDWANDTGKPYNTFFVEASPSEIAYLVKTGKISPWVIYLSETGSQVFERLNSEQAAMIAGIIDFNVWQAKMLKQKSDIKGITEVMEAAGI